MNPILLQIIQWIVTIMIVSGLILVMWLLIKNTGVGRLLRGIYDAMSDAARELGNQLTACAADFWSNKCWLKWVGIGVLGAQFIFAVAQIGVALYRTRIDSKIADARGKGITKEEANDMEAQVDEAFESWKAKNPEKAKNLTEEDEVQIKRGSLYRKLRKSIKKLLEKSDQSKEAKAEAEKVVDQELQELSEQAAEDNPEGNQEDVDDATNEVDENLDDMPDFF